MTAREPLSYYLSLDYPISVIPDPEGGYVVLFPDLPGCMTQIEEISELPAMAAEVKELWIETEYELGGDIPLPSYPETYSGKFNLRLPKSLHRRLAEDAAQDEVSLNQHVVGLLSERIGAGSVQVDLRAMAGVQELMRAEIARMATNIEEVRTTLETYRVEPSAKAPRTRRAAAPQPDNIVLFGAVAA